MQVITLLNITLTVSKYENNNNNSLKMKWDEIQRAILELERVGPVSQEEIDNLNSGERRENIRKNLFLAADHFNRRIKQVFSFLKTNRSLGKYRVKDYFYRVEFQMRGKFK